MRAVRLLGDVRVADADVAFVARLERALLDLAARRRAADVERPHRELRARLADRLAGDDADRLADVDLVPAREVAPVALGADAALGLAGEHRADDDLLDARLLDDVHEVLVELRVRRDEHLARERVDDVLERDAAEDAVAERLDDLAGVLELRDADAVERAAVELGDDRVLRDVDEAPGEVPGVRRLERRVGEALARAVGRDEVLEHRETLAEVRRDRRLDDLARRLGHQAAHGGELADLLRGASRSGVGHDVDRVEARLDELLARLGIDDLLLADLVHHLLRDLVGDAGPDVDDLVVALAVGDEAFLVLVDDALDLGLRLARGARPSPAG